MEYNNDLQSLKDYHQLNRFTIQRFQDVADIKNPLSYILENKKIS